MFLFKIIFQYIEKINMLNFVVRRLELKSVYFSFFEKNKILSKFFLKSVARWKKL